MESSLPAQHPQDDSNTSEIDVVSREKFVFRLVTKSKLDPGGIASGNQGSIQQMPSNGYGSVSHFGDFKHPIFLPFEIIILHQTRSSPSLDTWIGGGCQGESSDHIFFRSSTHRELLILEKKDNLNLKTWEFT